MYVVHLVVEAEAIERLRQAVQVFASARDFALVSTDGDPATLDQYDAWSSLPFYSEYYEGRYSMLLFNRERSMAAGYFTVEFRARHDVGFWGGDDLDALCRRFIAAVSHIDGVSIPAASA